jgi:hypothetical protein
MPQFMRGGVNFCPGLSGCWAVALSLALLTSIVAAAGEIDLSQKVESYSDRKAYRLAVARLVPGDIVRLGQKTFRLREFLGEGGSTRIFALSEDRAIRIDKVVAEHGCSGSGSESESESHSDCLSQSLAAGFLSGWTIVQILGSHVVNVYPELSSSVDRYAVVDRLPVQFTLYEYIHRAVMDPNKYPQVLKARTANRDQIEQSLVAFVVATAKLNQIGDFKSAQVVWTGERWVLVDWSAENVFAKPFEDSNVVLRSLDVSELVSENFKLRLRKAFKMAKCGIALEMTM